MREKIDSTYTQNGYECSICEAVWQPDPAGTPVIRVLNIIPDWPHGAEPVDALICPFCLDRMNQLSRQAKNPHFHPLMYTDAEREELALQAEEEERRFSLGLTD